MLLLTAPVPTTPNLLERRDVMSQNIQQLSLLSLAEGKTCPQCNQWKPLVKFFKGGYVGGRSPRCRTCTDPVEKARARDRARYRNPDRNASTKKRASEWRKNNQQRYVSYLRQHYQDHKDEHLDACKQYYVANRDRIGERNRKYQASHKTQLSEARRKYKEANADLIREQQRQSFQRHRPVRLAKLKAYRKAHPEVKQVGEARRYARLKGAKGLFGVRVWRRIVAEYGPQCLKCGEIKPPTIDHVVPVSKNGFDCVCNIQPLCLECNVKKHTRTADYRPFRIAISCPHEVQV